MSYSHTSALIVEGGAMRGIFASGVLDAFAESNHYPFDLVIGVSAGATNLVSYLSEQPHRSYRIITELASSSLFFNPLRFLKGGNLLDINWLWQASLCHFPLDVTTFGSQNTLFYAVATDVDSGKATYLPVRPDNMGETLTASCALPVLHQETPYVDGRSMADGGISDSIPVIEAYRRGARRMTVVLSEPWGYRKKPIRFSWIIKALLKNQSTLVQAMLDRHIAYNSALDFIANPPTDCKIEVIAPPVNFMVTRFTRNLIKLQSGYLQGYFLGHQSLRQAL